jgi:hypothetical protein
MKEVIEYLKKYYKEEMGEIFTMENLHSSYKTFQELKEIEPLLDPNNKDIKRMGLHWDAYSFKTISENLLLIEALLRGDIVMEEFFERFPRIKVNEETWEWKVDATGIGMCFFLGGGGGADEIRKKIKIGMESDNNTNKIIELIESLKESIIDQDLDRIKYYVAEISIKRMLDKMEK